jgi:hypothetical protein
MGSNRSATMKSGGPKRILILVALLIIIAVTIKVFAYEPFMFMDQANRDPNQGDYSDNGSYKIDPNSILTALSHGETKVFMPELATPEVYRSGVYSWHQADYFKIAAALSEYVWKESLNDWSLYRIIFGTDCQDNINGLAFGEFIYYKTVWNNGRFEYLSHEMSIDPLNDEVSWKGGTYFLRPPLGWKSIDLEKLKVRADDALLLAEAHGGQQARLKVKNQCYYRMLFSPNTYYNGWDIAIIANSDGVQIFEMVIDPYTGRILK